MTSSPSSTLPKRARWWILACGVAALTVVQCRSKAINLSLFLEAVGPSYSIIHTFGQLVADAPAQASHYMTVQVSPANTTILAPTSGTIRYYDNLDGRSSCLRLRPKLRKKKDGTEFEGIGSGLPDPGALQLALCNFEPASLEAAITDLYDQKGVDDPEDQADDFLDAATPVEDRPELDVWAAPEALSADPEAPTWSELGAADFDHLEIAAFVEDDDGNRTYVNPAPYLAKIPLTPSAAALRPPTIFELRLETATDDAFTASIEDFEISLPTGTMNPSEPLSGFLRVFFRLTSFIDDGNPAETVAPYEISYELRELGAGAPRIRSQGRYLLDTLPAAAPTTPEDLALDLGDVLYRTQGETAPESETLLDIYWIYLPIDPTQVVEGDEVTTRNAGDTTTYQTFLDLDAESVGSRLFPAGDYELEVTLANAFDPATQHFATASFTVLGPHLAQLTAAHAAEDDEETPGAAVRLNDDNDNGNQYPDPSPDPAHRPFEPWFDLEETAVVAGENDLMELTVDVQPHSLAGSATLTVPSGAGRIRLWENADKGNAAQEITVPGGGLAIPMADMPRTLWVEGIDTGAAEIHLEFNDNGSILEDTINLHVVRLADEQGGTPRVINTYGTDVDFDVDGGTADFEYRWDLNGDGDRATDPFETGVAASSRSVRYDTTETASSVLLSQVAGNKRQTYNVSVELTGGLVLERTIRVALNTRVGSALPTQDNPGIQGAFAWNNVTPITWDNVLAAQQTAETAATGITLDINTGNRIQHAPLATSYAVTRSTSAHTQLGAMEIWYVGVADLLWSEGWHEEEFTAVVDHEAVHLTQYEQVRADIVATVDQNANTPYRRIFTNLVFADGVRFLEAEAHLGELNDPNVEWGWQLIPPASTLQIFFDNYTAALGLLGGLPAADQALARTLLQDVYNGIPFEEMKVPNYDFFVQPPP